MIMACEVETRRASQIAYPCIACGSETPFERSYCANCLRTVTEAEAAKERAESQDLDALLERVWLRSRIERAA